MKKKSLVMMLTSLGLVGTIMVGATFAYFSDTTQAVTNTFTVGANVGIELLEDITQESTKTGYIDKYITYANPAAVVATDNNVKFVNMYPGLILNKKPFVQKETGTSDCYVVVKVKGIDALNAVGFTVSNIDSTKWTRMPSATGVVDGTYRYIDKLTTAAPTTLKLFDTVTYKSSEDGVFTTTEKAAFDAAVSAGIQMKACAIQADGFTSAENAFLSWDGTESLTTY